MAQFVVMEVYSIEANSLEDAKTSVENSSSRDSVVHVGESLSQMLNPFHWADAQNRFGHIAPAPAPAESETE